MPENTQGSPNDPPDEENSPVEERPRGRKSHRELLQLIWIYHPLALLVLALAIAAFSYSILPSQVKQEPRSLSQIYDESLQALRKVKNPLINADSEHIQKDIQTAKMELGFIFQRKEYREQLDTTPSMINPYLLFGDSLYLYGNHPDITQDRQKTFQLATWAFTEALKWEDRRWNERDQRIYDQQFFQDNEPFDERTLAARKLLRRQYEQYMRARAALQAQQYTQAAEDMENLLQDFRVENLGNNPNDPLKQLLPTLPPHEFEILPEDRVLLYFFLGQLSEKRGDPQQAERFYQIFLLHAKRSREYFIAMMRLGNFYFDEAERNENSDPKKAQRLYREAAEVFVRVVSASPPGDLLREAYFTGGRAFLQIALLMPIGEKTIWNYGEKLGGDLTQTLSEFANKNPLPDRTLATLPALGRLLVQSGLSQPVPPSIFTQLLAGESLSLTTRERLTPLGERNGVLRRAKAFFNGSQGGEEQRYDGASYVMLARTYMAEGDFERARGLLRYTKSKFWGTDVDLACRFGVATSYQQEGLLDRALVRFVGGVEKLQSSLLVDEDVISWTTLCQSLAAGSMENAPAPQRRIWGMLPENIQEIIHKAALTDRLPERFRPILLRSLNSLLDREDFYDPAIYKAAELPQTAFILRGGDIALLTLQDRQWLNRMLLDTSLGSCLMPTEAGEVLPAFPGATSIQTLNNQVLLSTSMVIDSLKSLARTYINLAGSLEEKQRQLGENSRLLAAAPRRALANASQVNRYMIDNYSPEDKGEIMLENSGILKRQAYMAANPPFRNLKQARELISEAANAYMKIGFDGNYPELEPQALLEAGANFFAAGRYNRASEALARFGENNSKSPEIGWARNLLGRCYWLQGRYQQAITTYRENSWRPTPDGRESMYYLGAVFLDAKQLPGERAGTFIDLLGDPNAPYAKENNVGLFVPDSALQVFNEIRRTNGITPSSRPWRWATFGLGKTWYEIAERARQNELAAARAADRKPAPTAWIPHFQTAIKVLREGLERYRLKYNSSDEIGTSRANEPDDYFDIMRQRMENEYFLAMSLRVQSKENPKDDGEEVRKHLTDIINLELYPQNMTDLDGSRLLLSGRSVLGVNEGPMVRPLYLETLRFNAFFFLAQSWNDEGVRLATQNKTQQANAAYDKALQVYRTARDRLNLLDGPRILYNMGEVMVSLNRPDEAKRLFMMAISQVNQLEGADQREDVQADLRIWKTLSENRIKDLANQITN